MVFSVLVVLFYKEHTLYITCKCLFVNDELFIHVHVIIHNILYIIQTIYQPELET